MEELTPERIIAIATKHLTPDEMHAIGSTFLKHAKKVHAMSAEEQHQFRDEKEVVEWLKRLASKARIGGDA